MEVARTDHNGLYGLEQSKQQYIVCRLCEIIRIRTSLEVHLRKVVWPPQFTVGANMRIN